MKYNICAEIVVEMIADNEDTAAEDFIKWINLKKDVIVNTSTIKEITSYINDVEEV